MLLTMVLALATSPPLLGASMSHRAAAERFVDFGAFCGFVLDGTVRPAGATPLQCLRAHLASCTPAYAHGARFTRHGEAHEAIFIRRDARSATCRVVVAVNTQPMIDDPRRRLASSTCRALVAHDDEPALLSWGRECTAERVLSTCPSAQPSSCSYGASPEVLACGAIEPTLHPGVSVDDATEPAGPVRIEPGWEPIYAALPSSP